MPRENRLPDLPRRAFDVNVSGVSLSFPGLTCPGLLAPDRRDAGSRRVGLRVHGRSEDRGYVVPQASDVSVAGDARWGSRPMTEHRVMSKDHLGLTHYRSRRCYESQPNCQRLFARSRHIYCTIRSPNFCERLRKSEMETSLESSLRVGVIAPRSRPGSPGGARPDARRLPATGHGWRRRNGPATGPRPASATAPASFRRYSPAARRPQPANRRSRLCPRGTTARCTPLEARNCPARILRSSLRVTNPAAVDPRPDRATAPLPNPPPQSSPRCCLFGRLQVLGSSLSLQMGTRNRHGRISWDDPHYLPNPTR